MKNAKLKSKKENGTRKIRALSILLFSFFIFNSGHVAAALFAIEPATTATRPGAEFTVTLTLDTEGESLNAVSGTVLMPPTFVVKDIREGNSIISLWLEKPATGSPVRFSGVIPGGFTGRGELFTLVVLGKAPDRSALGLTDLLAYRNDGKGTRAPARVEAKTIVISGASSRASATTTPDLERPESFTPLLGRDPNLFDGRYFIVFSTKDKASGVDHYEVAEERGFPALFYERLPWQRAESPHLLADQELTSNIYVKAIDREGNERVARLSPANPPLRYNLNGILAILVALAALFYFRFGRARPLNGNLFKS